jgi:hypothetical protein
LTKKPRSDRAERGVSGRVRATALVSAAKNPLRLGSTQENQEFMALVVENRRSKNRFVSVMFNQTLRFCDGIWPSQDEVPLGG